MNTTITFENVHVRYPGAARDAVDGVTLELPPGGFTVVLGPSGCGKSTLLRTINRLVPLRGGRVLIDGADASALDPIELRRRIGYAIQAVGLFPHLTVAQNIAVVPTLLGWEPARIAQRVDELLDAVRLDPKTYRHRRPAELSGGEQQRVGVARAIAARPAMLLMDEPFGAVDAIVRARLQNEMMRIVRAQSTTVVLVTHDVDEALRLADLLVVMQAGRVVQAGAPHALLTAPGDPFVAELLDTDDDLRCSYRLALLQRSRS